MVLETLKTEWRKFLKEEYGLEPDNKNDKKIRYHISIYRDDMAYSNYDILILDSIDEDFRDSFKLLLEEYQEEEDG